MKKRNYSLFVKDDKKWVRLTALSFTKDKACRIFQNALLGGTFKGLEMGLRPVDGDDYDNVATYEERMEKYLG